MDEACVAPRRERPVEGRGPGARDVRHPDRAVPRGGSRSNGGDIILVVESELAVLRQARLIKIEEHASDRGIGDDGPPKTPGRRRRCGQVPPLLLVGAGVDRPLRGDRQHQREAKRQPPGVDQPDAGCPRQRGGAGEQRPPQRRGEHRALGQAGIDEADHQGRDERARPQGEGDEQRQRSTRQGDRAQDGGHGDKGAQEYAQRGPLDPGREPPTLEDRLVGGQTDDRE